MQVLSMYSIRISSKAGKAFLFKVDESTTGIFVLSSGLFKNTLISCVDYIRNFSIIRTRCVTSCVAKFMAPKKIYEKFWQDVNLIFRSNKWKCP